MTNPSRADSTTSIIPQDIPDDWDPAAAALVDRAIASIAAQPELAQQVGWVHDFAERLGNTLTFGWLRCLRLSSGGGSGGASTAPGHFVAKAIAAGTSREELYSQLAAALRKNWGCSWLIMPLRGLRVREKEFISENAFVAPASDIPEDRVKAILFADPRDGPEIPTCSAALVMTHSHSRLYSEAPGAPEPVTNIGPFVSRDAHHIRLALGLASGGPVEASGAYVVNAPDDWLTIGIMGYSGMRGSYMGSDFEPDIALTRQLVPQIAGFSDKEPLFLAIDRLLRSRLDKPPEDRIIDLAIATEILLMHGQSGGIGEITNKVSSRAAWLVAGSLESRLAVADAVSDLYNLRSRIVHSGQMKQEQQEHIPGYDSLVRDIVFALLAHGRFPNWKKLVLGAASEVPSPSIRP